jgi:hypothetical protein
MKRYFYNSVVMCWDMRWSYSYSWSTRISGSFTGDFFGDRNTTRDYNVIDRSGNWSRSRFRSSHWSGGV